MARLRQIVASMWCSTAGFGYLLLWALEDTLGSKAPAMLLLLAGFASLIVLMSAPRGALKVLLISAACGRSRC
jgi:hypothetical protein